jgi:hypothetical protein
MFIISPFGKLIPRLEVPTLAGYSTELSFTGNEPLLDY